MSTHHWPKSKIVSVFTAVADILSLVVHWHTQYMYIYSRTHSHNTSRRNIAEGKARGSSSAVLILYISLCLLCWHLLGLSESINILHIMHSHRDLLKNSRVLNIQDCLRSEFTLNASHRYKTQAWFSFYRSENNIVCQELAEIEKKHTSIIYSPHHALSRSILAPTVYEIAGSWNVQISANHSTVSAAGFVILNVLLSNRCGYYQWQR